MRFRFGNATLHYSDGGKFSELFRQFVQAFINLGNARSE